MNGCFGCLARPFVNSIFCLRKLRNVGINVTNIKKSEKKPHSYNTKEQIGECPDRYAVLPRYNGRSSIQLLFGRESNLALLRQHGNLLKVLVAPSLHVEGILYVNHSITPIF